MQSKNSRAGSQAASMAAKRLFRWFGWGEVQTGHSAAKIGSHLAVSFKHGSRDRWQEPELQSLRQHECQYDKLYDISLTYFMTNRMT